MHRAAAFWLMLAFTRPDGYPVAIDSDEIVMVSPHDLGFCPAELTHVTTSSGHVCVKEGYAVVTGAVDNAKTHGHSK